MPSSARSSPEKGRPAEETNPPKTLSSPAPASRKSHRPSGKRPISFSKPQQANCHPHPTGRYQRHRPLAFQLERRRQLARRYGQSSQDKGFEYLVISDHSRSAFYANGLHPDRILAQHAQIDELNKKLAPFKIFKSIEADILNDGNLDYPAEILRSFDLVIASVHSNLKMPEEKPWPVYSQLSPTRTPPSLGT